jgi:hypothetical protein
MNPERSTVLERIKLDLERSRLLATALGLESLAGSIAQALAEAQEQAARQAQPERQAGRRS